MSRLEPCLAQNPLSAEGLHSRFHPSDGTTYSRFHPSNYLSHHLAGIVTAAVFSDAAHIVEEIALLKTRTSGATRTAAAANPIE